MSFFFLKKNATAQEDETQDALVALDIGSSKIRLIAGEVNEDGFLSLTYYAECHSEGVVNGAITDLTKLSHQIALLVADYKENGRDLTHCYIGIAGRYIKSANLQGGTVVPTHAVTEADREHAIENAAANRFSEYQRIIHIIPQSYQIGDTREIVNPIDRLVSDYPTLHTVICNGKKSEGLYQKHFSQLPLRQIYLPSTSNANRTIKEEALFDRWITALRESLQEEPS